MFLTLMWVGVAAGMITLITAAMKVQSTSLCKGYTVNITGSEDGKLFTSKENIIKLLKAATNGNIKDQRLGEFDLPKIEDLLEQSAWVNNAELYFDNRDVLRVNVIERKPLARVFTNLGESFYIDEVGKHIPLSEKISLDVPVFTGYPTKKILNSGDTALLQNIIATASFINSDPFWSSQVSQIDISSQGAKGWQMEMVPVVGNHRVQLGDGSDIATKFHRLYLFYDQVLKRKGFDKYQTIDVQYTGQVIGVKGNYTKIDSLQLRKNIENLLLQSRNANEVISETPDIGLSNYILDSATTPMPIDMAAEPAMDDTVVAVAPAVVEKPVVKKASAEPIKKAVAPTVKKEETIKKETKPSTVKTSETKKEDTKPSVVKKEANKPAAKQDAGKVTKKDTKPVLSKDLKPAAKPVTTKTADKKTATNIKAATPVKKPVVKADDKKTVVKPAVKPDSKKTTTTKPATTNKTTTKKNN